MVMFGKRLQVWALNLAVLSGSHGPVKPLRALNILYLLVETDAENNDLLLRGGNSIGLGLQMIWEGFKKAGCNLNWLEMQN